MFLVPEEAQKKRGDGDDGDRRPADDLSSFGPFVFSSPSLCLLNSGHVTASSTSQPTSDWRSSSVLGEREHQPSLVKNKTENMPMNIASDMRERNTAQSKLFRTNTTLTNHQPHSRQCSVMCSSFLVSNHTHDHCNCWALSTERQKSCLTPHIKLRYHMPVQLGHFSPSKIRVGARHLLSSYFPFMGDHRVSKIMIVDHLLLLCSSRSISVV